MDRAAIESRADELLAAAETAAREKGTTVAVALAGQLGESTRVITVRLPASYHEALGNRAHLDRTSINRLCVTRIMEGILREAALLAAETELSIRPVAGRLPLDQVATEGTVNLPGPRTAAGV
jgi:hypothetical protein